MKIVSIDPGLRNLGVVVLEKDSSTNKISVTYARVLDIARQSDTDSFKVKSLSACLHAIEEVHNADVCVVEDNNYGRANTVPDNLLIQSAAGATMLALGARELVFYQSSFKFSCFFSLTPSVSGRVKGKFKLQSKVLAQNLVESFNVTGDVKCLTESDHLSDSFGLGMAALVRGSARGQVVQQGVPRSLPVPVPTGVRTRRLPSVGSISS